jgi:hypothetical protein
MFANADRICEDGYVATKDDMIHYRFKTSGAYQMSIEIKKTFFTYVLRLCGKKLNFNPLS